MNSTTSSTGRNAGLSAAPLIGLALIACVAMPAGSGGTVPRTPESTPRGQPPVTGAAACLDASEREAARLINAYRREAGLVELRIDAALSRAAAVHARDMARNDFFAHDGSDGSVAGQRARRQGYVWRAVGENIGAGWATPDVAVDAWWHSEGHRHNMLGAHFRDLGVAHVEVIGSRYTDYWVSVYAAPAAPRADAVAPC